MTIEIVSLLKEKAITASDDAVTVNKVAQSQFKKWLQKGLNRERYYEKLKEEIENEKMD
mgnify:CR=1 FL=1